jgi:hypothetical protein
MKAYLLTPETRVELGMNLVLTNLGSSKRNVLFRQGRPASNSSATQPTRPRHVHFLFRDYGVAENTSELIGLTEARSLRVALVLCMRRLERMPFLHAGGFVMLPNS